ncbi:MAG: flagellar motor protein MotB [Kofleriaceae bacterium]
MARRYKKIEAAHGHHGGAWKVAYADFVTAMMALFMVLWLLASTDAASRKEISQYFRTGVLPEGDLSMNRAAQITPSVIETSSVPPEQGEESIEDKLETAKQISDKLSRLAAMDSGLADVIKNVNVQVTSEGVRIEAVDGGEGMLFDLSSAQLREPLERFLRAFAPALTRLDKPIEIDGHTDARPFAAGSKLSNWDLSYQRAAAAREILEASGVPPHRIVGVLARGSSQLYVPDQPLAAQNRRLSFLIRTKPRARTADAPFALPELAPLKSP